MIVSTTLWSDLMHCASLAEIETGLTWMLDMPIDYIIQPLATLTAVTALSLKVHWFWLG